MLVVYSAIFGAGILAGVLAGLLGIGGGLVTVPAMLLLSPDYITIHHIVATSLAAILPTSLSSVRSHYKRGNLDLNEAKRWAPPVAFGALCGTIIAHYLAPYVLERIFAVLAIAAALNMVRARPFYFGQVLPRGLIFSSLIGMLVGLLASWMGVGGGMFIVPLMVGFAWPMRKATAMGSLLAIFVAIPAIIGYAVLGGTYTDGFVGYLYLPYVLLIIVASIPAAPVGVYLGTVLPVSFIRRLFALVLVIGAIRILFN